MQARVLLPLTAVLAAHGWLLWQLPGWTRAPAVQDTAQADTPVFVMRSIAPPPPPPPAPPAPRPQAKPRPAPPAPTTLPAPLPEETAAEEAAETGASGAMLASESAEGREEVSAETPVEAPAPAPETLPDAEQAMPDGQATPDDQATPDGQAAPIALPPPTRLSFEVSGQAKGFDYRASAELLWQHDGHSYQARQQIKAFLIGTRAQSSRGSITAAGLVPQRFSDQSRREKSAELDFSAGQARFEPAAPPAPIGPGAQDRLSVFFQLSALLAAAPERYPAGSEISFTTVGSNDAERWTFRIQALQTLQLPLGTLAALPIERLPRHAGDQQAALWLAPALGYLPARIRLTQGNGDFADLLLQAHAPP